MEEGGTNWILELEEALLGNICEWILKKEDKFFVKLFPPIAYLIIFLREKV